MDIRTVIDTHPRTTRNESIPRWSQGARLTLGIITMVLITIFAVTAVTLLIPSGIPIAQQNAGPMHYLVFLATFAWFLLILFFVSFAAQNPRTDSKMAWMIGMIAMPFATLPIYWWVHIWKAPYVGDPHHDYNVPGGQLTPRAD